MLSRNVTGSNRRIQRGRAEDLEIALCWSEKDQTVLYGVGFLLKAQNCCTKNTLAFERTNCKLDESGKHISKVSFGVDGISSFRFVMYKMYDVLLKVS